MSRPAVTIRATWAHGRVVHMAAVIAIVLAAGSGWAVASTGGSNGVIHACAAGRGGALRLAGRCNKHERPVSWNVAGRPGRDGTDGTNGTNGINGVNGAPGAPGTARAFGLVAADGTLTRSKNATVSRVATGVYCITPAAGIDVTTTGIVATPDFTTDTTTLGPPPVARSAHIEVASAHPNCPGNAFEVETFEINTGNVSGDNYDVELANQSFFFVIP
jgi:hypothetical protein